MDFLIEIHREDEFLGGEIRFRISRLIAKSETRISNLNPDFPVERNLWCTLHLLMATASTKANNVVTSKQQHNNNNIHNLYPDLVLYKKMQLTYVIKNILASFSSLNSHFTYPNLRFKH